MASCSRVVTYSEISCCPFARGNPRAGVRRTHVEGCHWVTRCLISTTAMISVVHYEQSGNFTINGSELIAIYMTVVALCLLGLGLSLHAKAKKMR